MEGRRHDQGSGVLAIGYVRPGVDAGRIEGERVVIRVVSVGWVYRDAGHGQKRSQYCGESVDLVFFDERVARICEVVGDLFGDQVQRIVSPGLVRRGRGCRDVGGLGLFGPWLFWVWWLFGML